jgi:hypothetical protein
MGNDKDAVSVTFCSQRRALTALCRLHAFYTLGERRPGSPYGFRSSPKQFCQTPRFRIRTASRTSAACASALFLNATLYFVTKSSRNRSPNF